MLVPPFIWLEASCFLHIRCTDGRAKCKLKQSFSRHEIYTNDMVYEKDSKESNRTRQALSFCELISINKYVSSIIMKAEFWYNLYFFQNHRFISYRLRIFPVGLIVLRWGLSARTFRQCCQIRLECDSPRWLWKLTFADVAEPKQRQYLT